MSVSLCVYVFVTCTVCVYTAIHVRVCVQHSVYMCVCLVLSTVCVCVTVCVQYSLSACVRVCVHTTWSSSYSNYTVGRDAGPVIQLYYTPALLPATNNHVSVGGVGVAPWAAAQDPTNAI